MPYLDPVIERAHTSKQRSDSVRSPRKNNTLSLLSTCETFGIIGDPRGYEELAAFGRVPRIGSMDDEEEDEWWTPDWAIVSGVLPSGTVRRVLEGCKRSAISADGELVE